VEKTHRVGTLTLGVSLVTFGVMFMLRIFLPALSFTFIFKLWPLIFIFLGLEILIANFVQKDNKFVYDKAAVFLTLILILFAMGMSLIDFILEQVNYQIVCF